jgi:hypothetical protein
VSNSTSSAVHTPGPWYVEDEYVCAASAPSLGLCSVMNMDEGGDKGWFRGPVTKANAHLMAAAPDLLAALQDLFGAELEKCMRFDGHDDQLEAVERARAAVAKAQGASA